MSNFKDALAAYLATEASQPQEREDCFALLLESVRSHPEELGLVKFVEDYAHTDCLGYAAALKKYLVKSKRQRVIEAIQAIGDKKLNDQVVVGQLQKLIEEEYKTQTLPTALTLLLPFLERTRPELAAFMVMSTINLALQAIDQALLPSKD